MELQDLLEQVRQRRENDRLEKERVAEEQRAIEAKEVKSLLCKFAGAVQEYFGDVLDALNADASFQYLDRDLQCSFAVKHAIVSISMLDRDVQNNNKKVPHVCISAKVAEGYFSKLEFLRPSYAHGWREPQKARDSLLDLIFDICEEYDRLLPEFEVARKLTEYRRAIEESVDKSACEIEALIKDAGASLWTWPEGCQLELFKITWCCGAVWQSLQKRYVFDYDFGYSLSEFSDDRGYYHLLPQYCGHSGRMVKPDDRVIKERLIVSSESGLPKDLLESVEISVELVELHDPWEQSSRLLPELFPERPQEIAKHFEAQTIVEKISIGRVPCLPIRLAIEPVDSEDDHNFDDSEF